MCAMGRLREEDENRDAGDGRKKRDGDARAPHLHHALAAKDRGEHREPTDCRAPDPPDSPCDVRSRICNDVRKSDMDPWQKKRAESRQREGREQTPPAPKKGRAERFPLRLPR